MWNPFTLILPLRCPICFTNRPEPTSFPICGGCYQQILDQPRVARCRTCGIKLPGGSSGTCLDCKKTRFPLDGIEVFGDFSGILREAVMAMKFHKNRPLAKTLGGLLATCALPDGLQSVVPVPLGRKRMLERGFSQTYHLAKEVSRKKDLPLLDDLVIRKRETPPQSLLTRKERLKNLRDAFGLRRQEGKPLPESVLIVDDVMTTGATLSEIGKLLKSNGVRWVHALVLARAEVD